MVRMLDSVYMHSIRLKVKINRLQNTYFVHSLKYFCTSLRDLARVVQEVGCSQTNMHDLFAPVSATYSIIV